MQFPTSNNDVFEHGFQDEDFTVTPELEQRLTDIALCDGTGNEPLLAGLVLLLLQRQTSA